MVHHALNVHSAGLPVLPGFLSNRQTEAPPISESVCPLALLGDSWNDEPARERGLQPLAVEASTSDVAQTAPASDLELVAGAEGHCFVAGEEAQEPHQQRYLELLSSISTSPPPPPLLPVAAHRVPLPLRLAHSVSSVRFELTMRSRAPASEAGAHPIGRRGQITCARKAMSQPARHRSTS
jgi:hypothetical protein